jgi:dolichol-phosphate mannosyltransferase
MMASSAPYIAVMDADLQHDETILPAMLEKLRGDQLDLVVATRNTAGGSMGDFTASRVRLSNLGRRLSKAVSHCDLSDPMSGFFILQRRFLEEIVHSISGIGFKILLDIVASSRRPVRFAEIPYRFGQRLHGESKLDILVGLEYLQLLLDKMIGHLVPPRFVIFAMVGTAGAIVHLGILYALLRWGLMPFSTAQAIVTVIAMTVNFFLNNAITYRDRRLHGFALFRGLLTFYAACSVGALISVRIATFMMDNRIPWYLAGFIGIAVSSVWNFTVTALFTWRQKQRAVAQRQSSARAVPVQSSSMG